MANLLRWMALFCLMALASCVPNRKYVYLQKNDLMKNDLPKDSVVRHYAIDTFQYRIQPNDILSIRFESLTAKDFDFFNSGQSMAGSNIPIQVNPLLVGELVDESGFVFYPVVGKVKVAGYTVFEVQERLRLLAVQYVDSPVVKVRLLNFRSTILGEVNREGAIVFNNNRVTMLEAIGLSGGFTDLADKANVKLIRQKGSSVEIVYVNLLDENFINSPYYYIYQNDVLIVPALKQRPYRKYFGQNLALIVSTLSLLVLTLTLIK
ncbi:MAG: polysaccharide export protein [Cyclobacteriaceae bacterium]|nr:polysaccharide export protein [Cyclobacteriaceae bacterium]